MSTHASPLRRQPAQRRSARRVERMLSACAHLVDELGYDGVTTTLIAERAGVAVGSLYQFFPDKRAIVQTLALRHMDQLTTAIGRQFDTSRFTDWWDAVESAFDVYVKMHREVPGFSRLQFGDVVDQRLLDDRHDNRAVIADWLSHLLSRRFDIPLAVLRTPIAVAVEAGDAVLHLAFCRDPRGDDAVVREAKDLIRRYLAGRLGEPARPEGVRREPAATGVASVPRQP